MTMDGGWRRLNVLVTRAKWECILVSSLRGSELAAVNPNNRGAVALRDFLEFAARRGELPVQPTTITEGETNDFEDAVRAALVDRGFAVDAQVGASQYRIDLGVRDRKDPGRYVLGIECDGASYHSSRTARDRDLLRQQVLRGMGWRIHRVWSTEWFYERDRALDGILRSIEQAESRPAAEVIHAPATDHIEPAPAVEYHPEQTVVARKYPAGVPYELYRSTQRFDRDHILQQTYTTVLARTIGELVAIEGPIHHEFMVERLKDLHGVERAGSNIQANIKQAVRQAARSGTVEHEPRSPFYRTARRPLVRFRTCANGVSRAVEQIAPEELALAVLHLVEDQFGLAEERTPAAVARLFGIERLRSQSADTIRSVIDQLVSNGALRRSGTQLYLA
jgi:very-short-patch-repair endonuclease